MRVDVLRVFLGRNVQLEASDGHLFDCLFVFGKEHDVQKLFELGLADDLS